MDRLINAVSYKELFFNPNEQNLDSSSRRSSPFESTFARFFYNEATGQYDDTDDSSDEGEPNPTHWPIVQEPQCSVYDTCFLPYSSKNPPLLMAYVSISNVALQQIFNLRDFILSTDSDSLSGEVKFITVACSSVATGVGYTVMTCYEAHYRFFFGLIALVASLGLACLNFVIYSGSDSPHRSWIYDRAGQTIAFARLQVFASVQSLLQMPVGVKAAYKMMTHREPNMPQVSKLLEDMPLQIPTEFLKSKL